LLSWQNRAPEQQQVSRCGESKERPSSSISAFPRALSFESARLADPLLLLFFFPLKAMADLHSIKGMNSMIHPAEHATHDLVPGTVRLFDLDGNDISGGELLLSPAPSTDPEDPLNVSYSYIESARSEDALSCSAADLQRFPSPTFLDPLRSGRQLARTYRSPI
jgi:hypothetical protein